MIYTQSAGLRTQAKVTNESNMSKYIMLDMCLYQYANGMEATDITKFLGAIV